MKERDTPLKLVRSWPKREPGIYEQLDYLRGAKSDGEVWWPDYCLLPISAAFTYLADKVGTEQAAAMAAELTACWIWRQNKIVYKFDQELIQSLCDQAEDIQDTDVLPAEILLHLPYPCVYLKCPGFVEHIDGFFTWIEWDVNRKAPELRVQMVTEGFDHSFPMVLHLIPGGTVGECINDTLQTTQELSGTDFDREDTSFTIMLSAIQMILYISAENADVLEEPAPVRPVRDSNKAERRILDKAGEVRGLDVGIRVGAALRKARRRYEGTENPGTGARKRAHTRRGHWHHYWTGPKNGERKLILKWTAPTFIHPEDGTDDGVVVFPVK